MTALDESQVGDHVCWAYADDLDLLSSLSRYVARGLGANERVACYLPQRLLSCARKHLESAVGGAEDAIDRGALIVGDVDEAYRAEGAFDPDRRLTGYRGMVSGALADGFSALRIFGEATDIVNDVACRERWPGYELRADLLTTQVPLIAVCGYDLRRCDAAALSLLGAVHSSSFGSWSGDPAFRLHGAEGGSLALSGEVDFGNAASVEHLAGEAGRDVREPVLDVTELRFVDVSGMRAVVAGLQAMGEEHRRVRIRGAGVTFKRLWGLLDCDRHVDVEFEAA